MSSMPPTWVFSAAGKATVLPSALRATTTEISVIKLRRCFEHTGFAAHLLKGSIGIGHVIDGRLSLAVIAKLADLEQCRRADCA